MANSITAANAVLMLSITGLFPAPMQINGFAMDDIFSTDPIEPVETQMGVDGILSGGFVYVPVKLSISLAADSNANNVFDTLIAAQQTIQDVYFIQGGITLRSIGSKWTLNNGLLSTFPPIPDAGKVLKPRKFGITWESVTRSPV